MKTLIEELVTTHKNNEVFVSYNEEDDIVLSLPFCGKDYLQVTDTTITGKNFIENTEIILEKKKILGISWFEESQTKYLNRTKEIILKKISLFKNATENLKNLYTHDKKFVLYTDFKNSLFMIPFNIKDIKQLDSSSNMFVNREHFKKAIGLSVVKAKEIVDQEAKEYIDNNDLGTLEEIKAIKEIIDDSVNCIDLSNINTPKELVLNCWPVILTPNPFVVNV